MAKKEAMEDIATGGVHVTHLGGLPAVVLFLVNAIFVLLVLAAVTVVWKWRTVLRPAASALQDASKRGSGNGSVPDWYPQGVRTFLDCARKQRLIDVEFLGLERAIYWPRFLCGIFVFMGLLGTVAGIAGAVAALGVSVGHMQAATGDAVTGAASASFSPDAWQHVLGGIDDLLANMKSAFACTLFGLIATLVSAALNSVYIARARCIEAVAEQLASSEAGAADYGTAVLKAAITIGDSAAKLQDAANPAADALRGLTAKLQPTSAAISELGEKLAGYLSPLIDATKAVQAGTESLSRASEKLQDAASAIDKHAAKAEAVLQESRNGLAEQAEHLVSAVAALPKQQESLDGVARFVGASATQMADAVRGLQEHLVSAEQHRNAELEKMVAGVDEVRRQLEALLTRFEITLTDVTAIADSSPVQSSLKAQSGQICAAIASANQTTTGQIQTMQAELAAANRNIADVGGRLDAELGRMMSTLRQVQPRVIGPVDGSHNNGHREPSWARRQWLNVIEKARALSGRR